MNSTQKYRFSPKGVLTNMYDHMRRRHPVGFSLDEFHDRFLNDPVYTRLYNEWSNRGFQRKLKPSLDRISNKGDYTVANTQMKTWQENRFKQSMEGRWLFVLGLIWLTIK